VTFFTCLPLCIWDHAPPIPHSILFTGLFACHTCHLLYLILPPPSPGTPFPSRIPRAVHCHYLSHAAAAPPYRLSCTALCRGILRYFPLRLFTEQFGTTAMAPLSRCCTTSPPRELCLRFSAAEHRCAGLTPVPPQTRALHRVADAAAKRRVCSFLRCRAVLRRVARRLLLPLLLPPPLAHRAPHSTFTPRILPRHAAFADCAGLHLTPCACGARP